MQPQRCTDLQTYLGQLEYVASEQTLYPVLGRDSVGGEKSLQPLRTTSSSTQRKSSAQLSVGRTGAVRSPRSASQLVTREGPPTNHWSTVVTGRSEGSERLNVL